MKSALWRRELLVPGGDPHNKNQLEISVLGRKFVGVLEKITLEVKGRILNTFMSQNRIDLVW
jgi:hypothetical protein